MVSVLSGTECGRIWFKTSHKKSCCFVPVFCNCVFLITVLLTLAVLFVVMRCQLRYSLCYGVEIWDMNHVMHAANFCA